VKVEDGLDKAMRSYRRFLDETPDGAMTPEAMRRLADLKLEKEYGILGDGKIVEVAAPQTAGTAALAAPLPTAKIDAQAAGKKRRAAIQPAAVTESERALEQRAMAQQVGVPEESTAALDVPAGVGGDLEKAGPLEAIRLYDALLEKYPHYANRDQVLYQKARAYDELGRTAEAMKVMEQLIAANPGSHNAGRPSEHGGQWPQLGTKTRMTWSPGTRSVTPSPSCSTTPAASCPSTIGNGRGRSPLITERSE
jgi:tetratricopeptide (TPR) repeat protein